MTGSEQFSNQIGIHEWSQHDLRVKYVPLVTNSHTVMLAMKIYTSSDGLYISESNSTWYFIGFDQDIGGGRLEASFNTFLYKAHSDLILERLPNRSFAVGAKKIRFGFLEEGSPGTFGSIAEAFLSSRP